MKQIVELTCDLPPFHGDNLPNSQLLLEGVVSFTLDPDPMPNLKYFTFSISEATRELLRGKQEIGGGVRAYFAGLIAAFDRRGVDLYCSPRYRLHGRILIGDILEA